MKRFPKMIAALLVILLFVSICSTVSLAADLKEVTLTVDQLTVGYYNDLNGDITIHCANSDVTKETKNLVDNKSNPFYWSKPYAFNELKAYGGSKVPAILIDVAKGGDGVAISGFEMQLRAYMDCIPYWFEIQATTSAGSNQWVSIFEDNNTSWNGDKYHCEFSEVTVYKVRILYYDIGDADIGKDTAYGTLPADSTRFSLSEINLLTKIATSAPTEAPTQAPTEAATRPGIVIPTAAPTQAATTAPTQAPTAAPTQAPTAAPTAAPTEAPTVAPTEAPTAAPTEAPTVAPTEAPTLSDSSNGNIETLPTEAPTEAPTAAPTEAPTEALTEEVVITTVPATAPATQPEATTGNADNGTTEAPKDFTAVIIIAVIVAAAIAGGAVFFIIKKKNG